MKKRWFNAWACFIIALLVAGCGGKSQENDNKPTQLIYGVVPSEDADQTLKRMDAITSYFSKKLGMEVKCIQINNTTALIEAMRARKIDIASGGAFTYLIASEKANAEAIITTALANRSPRFSQSCLISYPGSGINSLEDLIKNAKKTTLAWAYPTSTTGHLVPRYALQQRGVMPEDFKEVFVSSNHPATILMVASHKVDVAAIHYTALQRFIRKKRIKAGDVKIIWTSDFVTPSPIFVRKDMDQGLKKRIQQAYLSMKQDSPETHKVLRAQYLEDVIYVLANDSLYQPIRKMANQIKGLEMEAD